MRTMVLLFIVLAALCGNASSAKSTDTPAKPELEKLLDEERAEAIRLRIKRDTADAEHDIATLRSLTQTLQHKNSAEAAKVEWQQAHNRINDQIYSRQVYYDVVILIMVIVIVMAGIWFSALQAFRDYKKGNGAETSLEITKEGLKIRSPVVGLIALFMSFWFFYVYVERVYTVRGLSEGVWRSELGAPPVTSKSETQISPKPNQSH